MSSCIVAVLLNCEYNKVYRISWIIWNYVKWNIYFLQNFLQKSNLRFLFSRVMVIFRYFCSKNFQFSMNFHDRKIVFKFVPVHCASFMKVGSKLRGGGGYVCFYLGRSWISKKYIWLHIISIYSKSMADIKKLNSFFFHVMFGYQILWKLVSLGEMFEIYYIDR